MNSIKISCYLAYMYLDFNVRRQQLRSENAHNANDTVRDISWNSLTSMPVLPLDVPFQVVIASVRAKKSR